MPKFYLVATSETKLVITRDYDTVEEAYANAEFLELEGLRVRLKVREVD